MLCDIPEKELEQRNSHLSFIKRIEVNVLAVVEIDSIDGDRQIEFFHWLFKNHQLFSTLPSIYLFLPIILLVIPQISFQIRICLIILDTARTKSKHAMRTAIFKKILASIWRQCSYGLYRRKQNMWINVDWKLCSAVCGSSDFMRPIFSSGTILMKDLLCNNPSHS